MISFVLPIITTHTDTAKAFYRNQAEIIGRGTKHLTFKPMENVSPLIYPEETLFPYKMEVNIKWCYNVSETSMIEYGLPVGEKHNAGIVWLKQRDIVGLLNKGYEYFEAMLLNDTNLSGAIKEVEDIGI